LRFDTIELTAMVKSTNPVAMAATILDFFIILNFVQDLIPKYNKQDLSGSDK